jgi:Arc/MetJ-type ribon-helix-helix transcriptional regulator
LKVTEAEMEALDWLVAAGKVISRSDALRVGLDMLLERFPPMDRTRRHIGQERRIQRPRKAAAPRPKVIASPPTGNTTKISKSLMETMLDEIESGVTK